MDRDMCINPKCVMKQDCIRYMGKADIVQSYSPFEPERNKVYDFRCVGYIHKNAYTNKKYLTLKTQSHD
jgi:hypothetical protein